jgi:hypothetical protein
MGEERKVDVDEYAPNHHGILRTLRLFETSSQMGCLRLAARRPKDAGPGVAATEAFVL